MLRLIFATFLCLLPGVCLAEKRVALVIGNNAYSEVADLQKAVADAEAVAQSMGAAGYHVFLETNVDRRETNLAISRFTAMLEPGDTAFVFFAGHGVQIDGENYLLPTDIAAPDGVSEGFVRAESIALSNLLERIRSTGARTTVAIIDACRDNPFPAKAGRSIGGTRGLARIAAPEGTFVMFSAGAGQQALDRLSDGDNDRNSVFTRALLPKLEQEGLELRDMIFSLREEVRALARSRNHQQFPAYYDELLGDFYVRPAVRSLGQALDAPSGNGMGQGVDGDIRADFDLARGVGTSAAYQRFIDAYADHADSFVVDMARDLLAALDNGAGAATVPAPPSAGENAWAVIRETQTELNRLGCDAGAADGIAGQRTRAAFAAFLEESRSSLAAGDLGTTRALSVLKAARGRLCKASPRTAAAPPPEGPSAASGATLAGTWSFTAKCPLFITSTGTARYRETGSGVFSGSWTDSLGQTGSSQTRLNGLGFSMTVYGPFGSAVETGALSTDGRLYTSQNTLGCRVSARRID